MRTTKYQGIDAIQQWHNDRSKSSVSEAFKDADYASPITRFGSDASRFVGFFITASVYAACVAGVLWISIEAVLKFLTK